MVFTSWAAAQVIIDEDMHHLSDEEQGQILGEVNRLVYVPLVFNGYTDLTCLQVLGSHQTQSGYEITP